MNLKSIRKDALYYFVDRAVKMACLFLMGVVIARSVSPQEYGVYVYLNSIITIILAIIVGGVDTVAGREFALSNISEHFFIYVKSVLFKLSMFAIVFIFYTFYLLKNGRSEFDNYKFIFLLVFFISIFNVNEAFMPAVGRPDLLLRASLLIIAPLFLLKCYLVAVHHNYIYKFIIDSLEFFMISLFTFFCLHKNHTKHTFKNLIDRNFFLAILPLWLNTILVTAISKIDQVMIGSLMAPSDVASYGVAVQFSALILIFPTVIMSTVFKKLVEKRKESGYRYDKFIYLCTQLNFIIAIAWIVFLLIFGEYLLKIIYGDYYTSSYLYLILYNLASIFYCTGAVAGQWTVIEGKFWLSFLRSIVGMLVAFVLSLILIKRFGVYGCLIATILTSFLTNYLLYGFFKDGRKIFVMQTRAIVSILSIRRIRYLCRQKWSFKTI